MGAGIFAVITAMEFLQGGWSYARFLVKRQMCLKHSPWYAGIFHEIPSEWRA